MTKFCGKCNTEKPVEEFNKKTGKYYQPYCRECNKGYLKQHYQNNKKYYVEKALKHSKSLKKQNTLKLFAYYRENPCIDCGENDPIVLESDHIGDKKFNISHMVKNKPWEEILEELSKCETRCANCHRRKTAKQFKWYGFLD